MQAKTIKEWRQQVLERDKCICKICGKPGNIADHIVARKLEPDLLLEVDNGRTLCNTCHVKHGTKVYAIKQQIKEPKPDEPTKEDWDNGKPYLEVVFLNASGKLREFASGNGKPLNSFLPGKSAVLSFTEYGCYCRIIDSNQLNIEEKES